MVEGFFPRERHSRHQHHLSPSLLFSGMGFGKGGQDGKQPLTMKSYGEEALAPIKDLIDEESGMREFFLSNEEWQPLFRSLVGNSLVPAMSFMESHYKATRDFDFDEETKPWRRLQAIPTKEDDKAVLAEFLDAMQRV